MKESKTEKWKSVGKQFLDFQWKVATFLGVVITVSGAFTNFQLIKEHPLIIGALLLIVTTFTALLKVIYKLVEDETTGKSSLDLPIEIEKFVKLLYKEKNYSDVVRLGSAISRFLWLRGDNIQRIAIGKMVEDSASKTGRLQEQISTLIDDIGWTYTVIGENEKARQNIKNGIEKAIQGGFFYFAAKGERHLAGIESSIGNKDQIIQHLDNAQIHTQRITDKNERDEMEASLFLAKSEYFFENKNYPEAELNAKRAKEIFRNDVDRIVKVYSLLGNIYLAQQDYQKAKDEFNQGYNKCKNFRKDEFAKNAVGLAKIEMQAHNLQSAKIYLQEAKEIFEAGNNNKEFIEVKNLLSYLDNAK